MKICGSFISLMTDLFVSRYRIIKVFQTMYGIFGSCSMGCCNDILMKVWMEFRGTQMNQISLRLTYVLYPIYIFGILLNI